MKPLYKFFCIIMCILLVISSSGCGEGNSRGADSPQEAVTGFMKAVEDRDADGVNKYIVIEFPTDTLPDDLKAGGFDSFLENWEGIVAATEQYPEEMLTTGQKIFARDYGDFLERGAPIADDFDCSAISAFCAVFFDESDYVIAVEVDRRWYVDYISGLDSYFGY